MGERISWSEPRWSFVPRTREALSGMGVLSPWLWVRITLYAAAGGVLLHFALRWILPGSPVLPVHRALMLVPMTWTCLGVPLAGAFLLPPTITVWADRITIRSGEASTVVRAENLQGAALDTSNPFRARLTLEYTGKHGEARSCTFGVGAKVDLAQLAELLGENLASSTESAPSPLRVG